MKSMDHRAVAERIANALGEGNLFAAAHCATRLRLVLNDVGQADIRMLDDCDDIKGTFNADGQLQIIIGAGDVNEVYRELVALTGAGAVSGAEAKNAAIKRKKNPILSFVKVLSDIFVPVMPALVAGGLLMALNNVLTAQNLFGAQSLTEMAPWLTDIASIINLLSAAPFVFMPILIGMSAAERFGGNGYLGAAIGMAMVMPALVSGYGAAAAIADGTMPYWDIFGLKVAQAGYQGMVIPVIAVAFMIANTERFLHKRIPSAFDFTFTPMLSVIVTGFLTFVLVGPVMRTASDFLTNGIVRLYDMSGFVGSALFGTFYAPIVVTGLHQSFPTIETALLANIAVTGGTFVFVIASVSNIAQGAATSAIFFATKDKKLKGLASSSAVSALLGITEPAMFGVNLKLKFPFVCSLIGAGISGALVGAFGLRATALGSAGVIGFISIMPRHIPMFLICSAVSFAIAFTLTFIVAKHRFSAARDETDAQSAKDRQIDGELIAVATGKAVSVAELPDAVFAGKVLGDGVAVLPESDTITSPANGTVVNVAETGHAFGLETRDGMEILVHIGIDTVKLNGKGFSPAVKAGDRVKAGEPLCKVDLDEIRKAGYEVWTPVIVTNMADAADFEIVTGTVRAGETCVIKYTKKENLP